MKEKITKYNYLAKLFITFLLSSFLFGCSTDGVITSKPIINAFTANPSAITVGNESLLTWDVTDATSVKIEPGVGDVKASEAAIVKPDETTTYTLTATNSAGSVIGTTTVEVNPSIKSMTIQPGPSYGKDAYAKSTHAYENFNDDKLLIGKQGEARMRTFIQFDLSSVPNNAVVTNAILRLYQYDLWGTGSFRIGAHRITQDWKEDTITFNNKPEAFTQAEHTINITTKPGDGKWRDWHIGNLVQGWLDGSIENYGILLKAVDEATINTFASFRASEYSNPGERPKLVIHYYIP